MRKIDELLNEYGESHQNKLNKAIHWICVPSIFFSIVGLLASIPPGPLEDIIHLVYFDWAMVALVLVLIYYIRLSIPLALGMLVFASFCLWLVQLLSFNVDMPLWQLSLIIFVVAWIGQFYGHKVEGKKPSFIKDLQFLLIGPAWLMHFIFKMLKIKY